MGLWEIATLKLEKNCEMIYIYDFFNNFMHNFVKFSHFLSSVHDESECTRWGYVRLSSRFLEQWLDNSRFVLASQQLACSNAPWIQGPKNIKIKLNHMWRSDLTLRRRSKRQRWTISNKKRTGFESDPRPSRVASCRWTQWLEGLSSWSDWLFRA